MALSGENGARQLAFVLSPNRRIDNPDLSQGRYLLLRRMRYEKVTTMESGRPLARHMDPSMSLKAEAMVVEPACEKRDSVISCIMEGHPAPLRRVCAGSDGTPGHGEYLCTWIRARNDRLRSRYFLDRIPRDNSLEVEIIVE